MRCEKAQEFFSDYIEHALERPMAVALEAHLCACHLCAGDLAALRQTWGALDALPAVEPPADFARRVAVRVAEEQWARRRTEETPRSLWQSFVRSLTPVHGIGGAAIALLLAAGLTHPLWTPEPGVQWDVLGLKRTKPAVTAPSQVPPEADPTLAPRLAVKSTHWENGRWVGTLVVTPERELPNSVVTATPLTPVGNQRMAGAEQVALGGGTMRAGQPQLLPIPLEANSQGSQTVMLQIAVPAAEPYRKVVSFPASERPGRGPISLELQDADVYVALARWAAAARRPVIADAGLTGRVSLQLAAASPEQALSQIVGPLGYRWQATPTGTIVTRY